MIARGRGWRPNVRPFAHTFSAVHPLSLAAVMADGSDLTPFVAPVMDQGQTSTCTGHASSDGAFTSFGKAGAPLDWVPSQAGIYVLGNATSRAAQGLDPATHPLVDQGAFPADVMDGIAKWGLRPMGPEVEGRFSDADAETCVAEPTLDELETDALHLVESHAIARGPNLIGDVCAALAEYAVPTGFFVDTAFEQWNPMNGFVGAPLNPNDPNGGGHYVDVVGFVRAGILAQQGAGALPRIMRATAEQAAALAVAAGRLASNAPVFFVKNSWGDTDWGLGGFFLATKAWLLDAQTSDSNAILPVMKEAA